MKVLVTTICAAFLVSSCSEREPPQKAQNDVVEAAKAKPQFRPKPCKLTKNPKTNKIACSDKRDEGGLAPENAGVGPANSPNNIPDGEKANCYNSCMGNERGLEKVCIDSCF